MGSPSGHSQGQGNRLNSGRCGPYPDELLALRTQGKACFARYRPGLGHGSLGISVGIVVILDFFKAHMADGTKARMVLDDLRMHGALVHNAMVALHDWRHPKLTDVPGENYAKHKRGQRPKKWSK
jgi:hypothetical protein